MNDLAILYSSSVLKITIFSALDAVEIILMALVIIIFLLVLRIYYNSTTQDQADIKHRHKEIRYQKFDYLTSGD